MRTNGSLFYLLGDHPSPSLRTSLGSTSLTTDANGTKVSELRYKPCPLRYTSGVLRKGELRYTWTSAPATTPDYKLPNYTFTGQYSYMDDPSTAAVTEGFGLMFYNARWYDPALGRFAQADTIIPGVWNSQSWDRYAYGLNSPLRYFDPTGHWSVDQIKNYLQKTYGDVWEDYFNAWENDSIFWNMLLEAEDGDVLTAPTEKLPGGYFQATDDGSFTFMTFGEVGLEQFQGKGPYILSGNNHFYTTPGFDPAQKTESIIGGTWFSQPVYDYSSGRPVDTGLVRVVTISPGGNWNPEWGSGTGLPWLMTGGVGVTINIAKLFGGAAFGSLTGPIGWTATGLGVLGYVTNSVLRYEVTVTISYIPAPSPISLPPPFEFPYPIFTP